MDPVREIWRKDGRFALEAYQFLFEALERVVKETGRDKNQGLARHVSGEELLDGLRRQALDLFGPLAGEVWRAWGIHSTLDWGRIVFLLVDAKLLSRQESDSLEDFAGRFEFDSAFKDGYRPLLPPGLGARPPGREE